MRARTVMPGVPKSTSFRHLPEPSPEVARIARENDTLFRLFAQVSK